MAGTRAFLTWRKNAFTSGASLSKHSSPRVVLMRSSIGTSIVHIIYPGTARSFQQELRARLTETLGRRDRFRETPAASSYISKSSALSLAREKTGPSLQI